MEILKDFVKVNEEGFDSYYISKDGRLLKLYKTGNIKFINPRLDAYGYMRVSITDNNGKRKDRKMHRLMAQTFLPNPENKPEVNHINGDKTDYRLENLEWCTRSENTKHWVDNSGYVFHFENRAKKIKEKQRQEVLEVYLNNKKLTARKISEILGLTYNQVTKVIRDYKQNDIQRLSNSPSA